MQFLAAGELLLQPELMCSAVIKIIFSNAHAMNAARIACCFYSIFQFHCQLITPHSIIGLVYLGSKKKAVIFQRPGKPSADSQLYHTKPNESLDLCFHPANPAICSVA